MRPISRYAGGGAANRRPRCESAWESFRVRSRPKLPQRRTPAAQSGYMPCQWGKYWPRTRFLQALKHQLPGKPVFISTTTETGQRLARMRLQCADGIFYFPLDWVVPVRKALKSIRPALVIIMETEIRLKCHSRRRSAKELLLYSRMREYRNAHSLDSTDGNFSSATFSPAHCKMLRSFLPRRQKTPGGSQKWALPKTASKSLET